MERGYLLPTILLISVLVYTSYQVESKALAGSDEDSSTPNIEIFTTTVTTVEPEAVGAAVNATGKWVINAADGTKTWVEGAAGDTKEWTKGAANDTKKWVEGAAGDTKKFLTDVFG